MRHFPALIQQSEKELLFPILNSPGDSYPSHYIPMVLIKPTPTTSPPSAFLTIQPINHMDDHFIDVIYKAGKGHWDSDDFRRRLKRGKIFLFAARNRDREIVSLAVLQVSTNICRIDDVLTFPGHRKKGYATHLMKEILRFHGARFSTPLFLFSENDTATRLYKKLGFKRIDLN
jgi:ribosomal protein S18 acetylase RimI-like enzyme